MAGHLLAILCATHARKLLETDETAEDTCRLGLRRDRAAYEAPDRGALDS